MLSDSDGERELREYEYPPARSSGSGLALAPPGALSMATAIASAAAPRIDQLNVSKKSRMHIGPTFEFVNVTQNMHNTEVVQELGLARYLWEWAKRTSRAERVLCCSALAVLAVCGVLACTLTGRSPPSDPDVPNEWNITRIAWLADPLEVPFSPMLPEFLPLRLVIVQHTSGAECYKLKDCAAVMRTLQNYFLTKYDYDVPYNFVVGNDGRVYEGRGWVDGLAAHTRGYNRCSLGLGFTGDYRRLTGGAVATELQLNRTLQLLEGGVRDGFLHPDYVVIAACDLKSTDSPGDDLYDALRQWPHFNTDAKHYYDRSCEDIYAELAALDNKPTSSAGKSGSR